ncbi:MAG: hypothetical protein L3J97_01460 [Thermoplasmata archaeon]|nr:hypothetical protein [Thermoplasmata archaeon]
MGRKSYAWTGCLVAGGDLGFLPDERLVAPVPAGRQPLPESGVRAVMTIR